MESTTFFIDLLDKWLHWICICVHLVQWLIFTAGKGGKLEDGVRMRGFFFTRPKDADVHSFSGQHIQKKIRERNLWEHLGRKIQPVTPRYICISQPCVYSDAQFIPPVPINRSGAETLGDGRGEV